MAIMCGWLALLTDLRLFKTNGPLRGIAKPRPQNVVGITRVQVKLETLCLQ